jgi:hypothetical protein
VEIVLRDAGQAADFPVVIQDGSAECAYVALVSAGSGPGHAVP